MAVADGAGLPVAIVACSASPAEVKLVELTLDNLIVAQTPERLIGDKAYESDALDAKLLAERGVELIAPHRKNRKHPTQDGRPLRRAKRRWKVERLFAWLHAFRRLVVRYEFYIENFVAMLQLACIILLLRRF
jgi:transposase